MRSVLVRHAEHAWKDHRIISLLRESYTRVSSLSRITSLRSAPNITFRHIEGGRAAAIRRGNPIVRAVGGRRGRVHAGITGAVRPSANSSDDVRLRGKPRVH